jgi:hypothetical protein
MRSAEWQRERRRVRDEIRRLPPEVQAILEVVRRDDLRGQLASEILAEAKRRAELQARVKADTTRLQLRGDRLLAVDERLMLREMTTPAFLARVRADVRRTLRAAHLTRIDPGQPQLDIPHSLPRSNLLPGHPWTPVAEAGLGTASYLDGPPDGWWAMAAGVAAWVSRSRGARGLDADVRVLVLDPGAGGLARAVGAVTAPGRITVQEFGYELTPTNLPWVEGDRRTLGSDRVHLVVWSVPSPAVGGASNQGMIYTDAGDPRARFGIGRVGPRRWRRIVRSFFCEVLPRVLLNDGGVAIVRLPLGYRVDQRARGRRLAFRGYVEDRDQLDGLLDDPVGFRVTAIVEEATESAVRQPFVASSRCAWRTVFFRMEGTT